MEQLFAQTLENSKGWDALKDQYPVIAILCLAIGLLGWYIMSQHKARLEADEKKYEKGMSDLKDAHNRTIAAKDAHITTLNQDISDLKMTLQAVSVERDRLQKALNRRKGGK